MKKVGMWFATLLVAILGLFCFASCGDAKVEGTYKFSSMEMNMGGMEMKYEAGKEVQGTTITEDFASIELKTDGTMTFVMQMTEMNAEGTWKKGEGKNEIIMMIDADNDWVIRDDEKQSATCDGKTLVFEINEDGMEMKLTLKK